MADRCQINAQLDPEQKQRWEEYANDNHRSLSQLVRLAVEKEISGRDDAQSGDAAEELSEHLSNLQSQMQRVESKLHDVDGRLTSIESEVRNDPETTELASDVFEVLPVGQDEVITAEHSSGPRTPPEYGEVETVSSGRVDDFAQALDVEAYEVRQALDHLQQQTHQVQTVEVGDETRYYKQE